MELIKKLWNTAWDMWDQRNEALHATTIPSQLIRDSRINDEIRSIYSLGFQALPWDAFVFLRLPVEAQLDKPHHIKEQWIASVWTAMKRKSQHEYGNYLSEQRVMRRWLGLEPWDSTIKADLINKLYGSAYIVTMMPMTISKKDHLKYLSSQSTLQYTPWGREATITPTGIEVIL